MAIDAGNNIWYGEDKGIIGKLDSTKTPIISITPENNVMELTVGSSYEIKYSVKYIRGNLENIQLFQFAEIRNVPKITFEVPEGSLSLEKFTDIELALTIDIGRDIVLGNFTLIIGVENEDFSAFYSLTISVISNPFYWPLRILISVLLITFIIVMNKRKNKGTDQDIIKTSL